MVSERHLLYFSRLHFVNYSHIVMRTISITHVVKMNLAEVGGHDAKSKSTGGLIYSKRPSQRDVAHYRIGCLVLRAAGSIYRFNAL